MIKIERQSTELTNKKTIEKEIILNNKKIKKNIDIETNV